ncbi:hypothetical protein [Flavobacterium collinsii]|jgi:hypothetical protein|uniref:Uncharacterized protein n=1 Tax=Flavobacterium collinsii TaxID=1114861 RepID=A0ABN7EHG9_9FLAO|nr:hypothetical protein [Flavobacterium collinsii]CAA9197213.1 hypothetical protein FLACOL7796_01558 [Flavobacterium collinsii]
MESTEKIQNLIPIGYLFLVVLGILKECVFFFQLKINILKYSTIMDILISPIADLTANPIIILSLIVFAVLILVFLSLCYKDRNKSWAKKLIGTKPDGDKFSDLEIKSKLKHFFLVSIGIGLLSFFLGLGIGEGHKIAEKIRLNKLKYEQKLTFNTGETEAIFLIDVNSAYYFYLTPKNNAIKIAPLGSIKNIELTNFKSAK